MPVTRKHYTLGLIIAAAAGAAVYAIGNRAAVEVQRETVRPAAIADPTESPPTESEPDVRVIGPVPTYWAKTSDFDSAPLTAQRDTDAPLYVPPPIYPLKSKQTAPITSVDPVTAQLPGGAVPDVEIEIPPGGPGEPE